MPVMYTYKILVADVTKKCNTLCPYLQQIAALLDYEVGHWGLVLFMHCGARIVTSASRYQIALDVIA